MRGRGNARRICSWPVARMNHPAASYGCFMNLLSGHDAIESIYRVDTTVGEISEWALSDGRYREISGGALLRKDTADFACVCQRFLGTFPW
jgi:hypothetical protein